MEQRYDLSGSLLHWYDYNKRILPWRENKDPYRIWISEIMLQQTRVEAVKPYFDRFMEVLPTVYDLAKVDDDRLMKLWEGLGYYNRARNLKAAAQTIVEEYGGQLPADYDKLLSLKGIGMYTAGAIGSIAFELQVPAVDGNVLRVLTRLWGDDSDILKDKTKKAMGRRVMEFMPEDRPGDFNQALIELGATVCVPNGQPLCDQCPWDTEDCLPDYGSSRMKIRKWMPKISRNGWQSIIWKMQRQKQQERENIFSVMWNGTWKE